MKDLLMFIVITAVVIFAADQYFDYVVSRDILPQALITVLTGAFVVTIVCYFVYIVKVLKRLLNINPPKKEEEK